LDIIRRAQRAYEENYEAGTLSGPKRIYFPDGKLCREYYYVNGDNEGPFAEYYQNGNLYMKGQYRFDLLDGIVEVYDETGTLIKTISYKLGEAHGPTVYFTKKVKSAEVEFYNGLPLK
jgi:antitoxin component YwqK of YwqJK toxin-antitoxin module